MQVFNSRKQTFLHGTLLLTIAGLLSKILSAMYRIPYQNIAGDVGFFIYQQVYPFYGIALALSLYGFPVVISKMISEVREDSKASERRILTFSLCTLLVFGLLLFSILYGFSTRIATWMGDPLLNLPIKMVSFSFLLLPLLAVSRGKFQGHENMVPTALSQIVEQFIRVATILLLTYYLVSEGFNYYEVGAGAVLGSITGGFAAIAVLLFFRSRDGNTGTIIWREYIAVFSKRSIRAFPFKTLLISSMAICTTGLILVLLQLVDSFTLYTLLLQSGQGTNEAMVTKGVYDRGQPLLQLGVVLATSLSLSLVPTIAKAVLEKNNALIHEKSRLALKISLVVGTGAVLGLISIMKYTNFMLFTDMAGSNILSVLSVTILFTSLTLTSSAILQGLGYIRLTAFFVLIGVSVKWALNGWLIPVHQTLGAAISSVIAVGVMTVLTGLMLHRKLGYRSIFRFELIIKTALAGIGMWGALKGYEWVYFKIFTLEDSRLVSSLFALSASLVGGIVFLGLIILLRIFDKKELSGWNDMKKVKAK
ncbi:putative polysaccharide biosynthesis protein [Bacillus sp. DJP31]|uniref:putative polysaccharide biosynthesis protein n=1 Tax=Bacillus sp. DJP31 TaxID=3409789 RepID=UPI003BB5A3BE